MVAVVAVALEAVARLGRQWRVHEQHVRLRMSVPAMVEEEEEEVKVA